MLVLHIANKNYSSWSLRPWILMHELGIAFTERLHPFEPAGDWTEFRRISPSGLVPCLVDGDVVVWDSLAIIEYLNERFPAAGVWPSDIRARTWSRSVAAEMHSGYTALRHQCSMNMGLRVKLHEVKPALQHDLDRLARRWQDGLERFGGPYLAGAKFSAVDAFFAPVAFRIQTYGIQLPDDCLAYAAFLRELPHMRAWYEAGLAEPWRDEAHDEGSRRYGVVTADLRHG